MAKQEIVEIAYQVDLSDLISAQAKKAGLSTKETKQLMTELKKRETASTRAIKKIETRQTLLFLGSSKVFCMILLNLRTLST